MDITVVIPTLHGGPRLRRLLESLRAQTVAHQTIVVDNGSHDDISPSFPDIDVIALTENVGYGRAVNMAAARADGQALVLLNDDCTCEPAFVAEIAGALAADRGVLMAAGVLRSADAPAYIDTAGMELDATLLPFDYLNGEPVSVLTTSLADPIGPSAAAAAFDRAAFVDAGGFDERLFAYWEDVDLVLRLRSAGARCALARGAVGTHEHSATLGSGSRAKNYLMGFGRGYVLRKWSVLTPRHVAGVVIRDVPLCLGQALIDRNVAGIRGRVDGYAAAKSVERHRYPKDLIAAWSSRSAASTLVRRGRRRARLSRGEGVAAA